MDMGDAMAALIGIVGGVLGALAMYVVGRLTGVKKDNPPRP